MISILTKLTGTVVRFAAPKWGTVVPQGQFLKPNTILSDCQIRPVTKVSLRSGKRKSVKIVPKKFFRLAWGCWIRTRCGRHKRIYKKQENQRRRLRQHLLTNGNQSSLLDKMVTKFWRKPKYYLDDPYLPYHSREDYYTTYKVPK